MKSISKIFTEIKDSWLMDVRHLAGEQLLYDRNLWIKKYGKMNNANRSEDEWISDIYTIAIMMEQLRRFGKIYYNNQV